MLSVLSFIFMRRIVMAFGAAGDLIDYCTLYGRISCISLTAFMPVSYTHLDVYKRQSCGFTGVSLSDRTGHGDKRGQIFYRNTNRLSLFFAGKRSWRICFNGSLSVKRIELLYSVVKEHERRKSSFLYTALEKSRSVTNIQNFFLFLYHIGKESVILLS